ncbi:MAG: RagB/SusD family nutrient uptake outer membrane protein [Marinifilaceae bacterium]|jgi:hypothetical protein|nr:RagB/SusD family nutrient uptake outer membrane protein [Marinifilaceae bacterium]
MQKIKLTILFILVGIFSQSCSDDLELTPEVAATKYSFWKNEGDLAQGTRNVMIMLKDYMGQIQYTPCSNRGVVNDNPRTDGNDYRDYRWTIESINESVRTNGSFSSWANIYEVISYANHVIENIDIPKLDDETRREFWLGQALFYRSFAYFHLVRSYGDVVLIKSLDDTGAKARTPWRLVLDYALEGALEARKLLQPFDKLVDMKGNKITDKQYAGRGSANALIAHICAYRAGVGNTDADKEYLEDAIAACTRVIEGDKELGDTKAEFELLSIDAVCNDVMEGHSKEGVWEINGDFHENYFDYLEFSVFKAASAYPFNEFAFNINDENLRPIVVKKTTVAEMYKNEDERREAYFYQFDSDPNPANEYAFPYKWRDAYKVQQYGSTVLKRFKGNNLIFRLSGIYLLRAECYSKISGMEDKAIADLNTIRTRANADLYNPTENEGNLTYTIFKEREKELLWEGHRFFDIQRNHLWKTELTGSAKNFTEQDVKDGALWLPVSKGAFFENDLMRESAFWNLNLKY